MSEATERCEYCAFSTRRFASWPRFQFVASFLAALLRMEVSALDEPHDERSESQRRSCARVSSLRSSLLRYIYKYRLWMSPMTSKASRKRGVLRRYRFAAPLSMEVPALDTAAPLIRCLSSSLCSSPLLTSFVCWPARVSTMTSITELKRLDSDVGREGG